LNELKTNAEILYRVFPRCVYPVALLEEQDIEFLEMLFVQHVQFASRNYISFPLLVLKITDTLPVIQTPIDDGVASERCSNFVNLFLENSEFALFSNVLKTLSTSQKSIQMIIEALQIETQFLQFLSFHEANTSQVLSLLLSFDDPDLFQWIEHYHPRCEEIHAYRTKWIIEFEGYKNVEERELKLMNNNGKLAKLFFYILRSIIRLEVNQIHTNWFIQIASSSAVKALLHTVVTPRISDELLRVAFLEGNEWTVQYLLAIPAVFDSASQSLLAIDDQQQSARLVNNTESSMEPLNLLEENYFSAFLRTYKEQCGNTGLDVVWENLRTDLGRWFEEGRLSIKLGNGYTLKLPLEWEDLELEGDLRQQALQQYYRCPIHTAWRYLAPDNPWVDSQSPFLQFRGGGKRIADSQVVFKETIALIYLGLMDETALEEGYELKDRIMLFFHELAAINRAHNDVDAQDDLQGDKPSCSAGVKRRLLQSIHGHPKLKILTKENLLMKVKQLVKVHWKDCFERMTSEQRLHLQTFIAPVLLRLKNRVLSKEDHELVLQFNVKEEKIKSWCDLNNEGSNINKLLTISFLKRQLKYDVNDIWNCHLAYYADLLKDFGVEISTASDSDGSDDDKF
jgi:hypothetical protein